MSLRRQLILVSLLLLTLPWAGCQFLREMETALRQGTEKPNPLADLECAAAGKPAVAGRL